MEIHVTEKHDPKPGGKMGQVIDQNGERYYAYPEMLGRFQPGTDWRIETTESEWQGRTYKRIVKAAAIKQAAAIAHDEHNGSPTRPQGAGGAGAPKPAAPTDETYFVVEMLKALIGHGQVKVPEGLGPATKMLRDVYRGNLGGEK